MSTCCILGIPIEVGKSGELFEKISSLVGNGGVICTPNPVILSNSLKNPSLRRALLSADLLVPDGCGLLPYLRRVRRDAEVLAGVDLGRALVRKFEGLSLGIVGGAVGVSEAAFSSLAEESRGLRPAFLFDGYSTPLSVLLSRVAKEKPQITFVCLGSPKQEILMHALHAYSPKTLFLGLGGSLDVYAGRVRRAPPAVRALHLEWLHRMLKEPRRFSQLPVLLRFPFLCHGYREENNNVTKNLPVRREN